MFNFFFKQKPENTLPHWGDAKNWVEKVIDSVDNSKQTKACRELIYLWCKTYSNELDHHTISQVRTHLTIMCDSKFFNLKEKELLNNIIEEEY